MKLKRLAAFALTAALALSLTACGEKPTGGSASPGTSTPSSGTPATTPDAPKDGFKVGLVLSTGGLGDKNFNDMSYDGMLKAEKNLGITFDYLESTSPSDFLPNLRMLAETEEYALIIGLGADMAEAITEISTDFPDQKFSHIDSTLNLENVSCVQTKWQEQTFLTGVLAGLGTLSTMDKANSDNVVGVILGMDNPALRMGVVGFEAGARYVNPDCKVLEGVVDSFNDPGKGKEIALSMYNQGADFLQSIAGASGLGIFNAAKEAGRYAFGVGANANYIEPDYVPATAMRKVDEMVYNEVKAVIDGTWSGGAHISGIKEDSVGYDASQSNVQIPQDIQDTIEEIRQMIVDGKLVPPTSADELDAWVTANQYSK